MNCPKCNSYVNEGDKFCQTCGNVLNSTEQQPVVGNNVPTTNLGNEVVSQEVNQPVNIPTAPVNTTPVANQPMFSQEVPQAMPNQMGQPMAYDKAPKKNNNLIILIIIIVAVAALAFAVYAIVSSNNDDKKDKDDEITEEKKDEEEDDPEIENNPIIETTTQVTIGTLTFTLPKGYVVEEDGSRINLYDTGETFQSIIQPKQMNYDLLGDAETVKEQLEKTGGYSDITYATKTINGKDLMIFYFTNLGFTTEVIYVEQSTSSILVASVVYVSEPTATKQSEIYNILTTVKEEV